MAGTSSSASTTPRTSPATADGTLSMSFSRHSCAAAARGGTPSAASSAFSARRWRTPAAMLTQNPVMASTAAATATASSPCCGTVDSGSASSPAAIPLALVTAEPGGSARPAQAWPVRAARWTATTASPARVPADRGQEGLQGAQVHDQRAAAAGHRGERAHRATIFTLTVAPSRLVCTVEPTLALLWLRKSLGGQAGKDRREPAGPASAARPPGSAGGRRTRWPPGRSPG